MNPILPLQHFVPDAEARVWNDGRMYLYGSYDISSGDSYCSYEYHVFSSADLEHWQHHGEAFRSTGPRSAVPWADLPLYAPDCIYVDGRYFLFFCLANGSEGVAVSQQPEGPFSQASPVQGADGDGIDPAALVDDDGQVYYYWGQHRLRGARLNPQLNAILPDTLQPTLLTEEQDGFHEGASIRKRNGLYYLVYTDIHRGRATCLSYATSRGPLGPFKKGGVIIDNTGCDPETWNNHGSIAAFGDQWYIFYHRSSQASRYNRRVCIEPIHFNADGSIDEVEMTTQGGSPSPDARAWMDASRACLLSGQARSVAIGPGAGREGFSEHLALLHNGDWAAYKYLDFGAGVSAFSARAGSLAYGGTIELRLDAPDGERIGAVQIERTGGWQQWQDFTCPVRGASGVRALYLVCKGREGRLFDLQGFRFLP